MWRNQNARNNSIDKNVNTHSPAEKKYEKMGNQNNGKQSDEIFKYKFSSRKLIFAVNEIVIVNERFFS